MTGDKDEAQPVVVQCLFVEVGWLVGVCAPVERSAELGVFFSQPAIAPEAVNRLALAHGRQPGARVGWDTVSRPLAQRVNERLLGQLFGQVEVVRHPCQRADDARELHSEHGLDGGGRIGKRHAADSTTAERHNSAGDGTDPDFALAEDVKKPFRPFNGLPQVSAFHQCPAADDLLRLDKRAVNDGELAVLESDLGACGSRRYAAGSDHYTSLGGLLDKAPHTLVELG